MENSKWNEVSFMTLTTIENALKDCVVLAKKELGAEQAYTLLFEVLSDVRDDWNVHGRKMLECVDAESKCIKPGDRVVSVQFAEQAGTVKDVYGSGMLLVRWDSDPEDEFEVEPEDVRKS